MPDVNASTTTVAHARGVTEIDLVSGARLTITPTTVLADGVELALTPAPAAVLRALAMRPGHVVSRTVLLRCLPSGTARSEHAVEVAVARLRRVVGAGVVQTTMKRGYRLATEL